MEYYLILAGIIILMMVGIKVIFSELEYRNALKNKNIVWFTNLSQRTKLTPPKSIVLMCLLIYVFSRTQDAFTLVWFVEMGAFVAVGVIGDTLGKFVSNAYLVFRSKKEVIEYNNFLKEIGQAIEQSDDIPEDMFDLELSGLDVSNELTRFVNNDSHLAILSSDGGSFVNRLTNLPVITYAVERQEIDSYVLENKNIKTTTYTPEGKLPFKDEKIDILVNQLTNYDKYEVNRVLKPGGYAILNQVGTDNYIELLRYALPFGIKGSWDKDNCIKTLEGNGFKIVDSYEERGHLEFENISTLFAFLKRVSLVDDKNYNNFLNFLVQALEQIKYNKVFQLTTHKFFVIVQKIENSTKI